MLRSLLVALALLFLTATALAKATPGRFVIDPDGVTVHDNATGLTWQRPLSAGPSDWSGAKAWCASNPGGLPGTWRLASRRELLSIVDSKEPTFFDPAVFPTAAGRDLWSSTPGQTNSTAWVVMTTIGLWTRTTSVSDSYYIRCVR